MSQILKQLSDTEQQDGGLPGNGLHLHLVDGNHLNLAAEKTPLSHTRGKILGTLSVFITLSFVGMFGFHGTSKLKALTQENDAKLAKIRAINHQALESFYTGQHERALSILNTAVEIDPENEVLKANQAIVLRHLGKINEAAKLFEEILLRDRENSAALNGIGRIQLDAGDLEHAEANFKRALAKNPGQSETFLNLGEVAEKRENWTTASAYYASYLQSSNSDATVRSVVSRRKQNINNLVRAKE